MYSTGARIAVVVIEVGKICLPYIKWYRFYNIIVFFFYQIFVIFECVIASE